MSETLDILFDPEEDRQEKPTLLGTFPAHIVGFKEGQANRGSIPYNVTFKIAEEAGKLTGINWRDKDDENSEGSEVDANYMPGRTIRSRGIWLNPNPKPEERWRNRGYVEFLEAVGVDLPEIEKDGKKYKKLKTMEEHELLGLPCMITIKLEPDKRKDFAGRMYPKVFSVQPWENGERIDVTEDEEDVFAE